VSNFFRNIVEKLKDDDTSMAVDGLGSAEVMGYIDSGCYALNGLLSGSIFKGVADNRCTGFAGDPATGKTFFVMSVLNNFLASDPEAGGALFDTESATSKGMMEGRNIDTSRVILSEPVTIQDFRSKSLNLLDLYAKSEDRPPMMMVLDSLGQLSSLKEIKDTAEGNDVKDMTKAGLIKGTFRVLRLKMAKLRVPMLVTNHVYANVGGYGPPKVMSGGSGLPYTADQIAFIAKSKVKEGEVVTGNVLTVTMFKSRLSRENQKVQLLLNYDRGLDRYYGLADIATEGGVFEKVGPKILLPDGRKVYGKEINETPEEVYTPEVLQAIDVVVKKKFAYGSDA
jgi:RecA/RadA recombinase